MVSRKLLAGVAIFVAGGLVSATPAAAKCTRLGFSVNDYGKEGPIKDAKALLDKYIADWAAQRNIKGYRTGKKDVKCELFLDFGFFDEHTCRAEATVCWGEGNQPAGAVEAAAPAAGAPVAKNPVPKKKAAAPKAQPAAAAAAPAPAPAPAAAPATTATVPAVKKAVPAAAPAAAAKPAPAVGQPINTPVKAPPPAKKKADQPS